MRSRARGRNTIFAARSASREQLWFWSTFCVALLPPFLSVQISAVDCFLRCSFDREFMTKDVTSRPSKSTNWVKREHTRKLGAAKKGACGQFIRVKLQVMLSVKVCVSRWLFPKWWRLSKWKMRKKVRDNSSVDKMVSCKKSHQFCRWQITLWDLSPKIRKDNFCMT